MAKDTPALHQETGRRVESGESLIGEFTYSVVETAPKPETPGDRRGDARARSRLREGEIGERFGHVLVACRIRDLSKRGARLQLDHDLPLPKVFLLTETGTDRAYWATLAWQEGREVGTKLMPIERF